MSPRGDEGLRELFLAKLEALEDLCQERDRLYKERYESQRAAVDAALAAVKENTKASFEASEKAIVKAEDSQREYNIRSNEFRGQLDDQAKLLMSRSEAKALMDALEGKLYSVKSELDSRVTGVGVSADRATDNLSKEIQSLRESRSEGSGKASGLHATWAYIFAGVAFVGSIVTAAVALYSLGLRGAP